MPPSGMYSTCMSLQNGTRYMHSDVRWNIVSKSNIVEATCQDPRNHGTPTHTMMYYSVIVKKRTICAEDRAPRYKTKSIKSQKSVLCVTMLGSRIHSHTHSHNRRHFFEKEFRKPLRNRIGWAWRGQGDGTCCAFLSHLNCLNKCILNISRG